VASSRGNSANLIHSSAVSEREIALNKGYQDLRGR
jgi:hypothetical protein